MISDVNICWKEDGSWIKMYSCKLQKGADLLTVQMETDGIFRPHMTKQQFIDLVNS